ncbi:V-type proton ATPase subunit E-like [Schistocerca nitens]|uniref:V-type proton ATPase subunit E-like n=1 Tax=Schistocerca nitens TaxID=7011 RepID=UPI002118837A|nr:V-type proton ATPase subunit E-like [Schistocerca nitens]
MASPGEPLVHDDAQVADGELPLEFCAVKPELAAGHTMLPGEDNRLHLPRVETNPPLGSPVFQRIAGTLKSRNKDFPPSTLSTDFDFLLLTIVQEGYEKAEEMDVWTEAEVERERREIMEEVMKKMTVYWNRRQTTFQEVQALRRRCDVRFKIMEAQRRMTENLVDEVRIAAGRIVNNTAVYEPFLFNLIMQGMLQLTEPVMCLKVRRQDLRMVEHMLPQLYKEYKERVGQEVQIKLMSSEFLRPNILGGVVLTNDRRHILIENTLNTRVQLVCYKLMPKIRDYLFGRNVNRQHDD